jgi:signal transduction histidine kinase/CheY-like chemotaxis protein
MPLHPRLSLRSLSILVAVLMALLFGGVAAFMTANSMIKSDREEAGQLAASSAEVAVKILDRTLSEGSADLLLQRNLVEDAKLWTDLPRMQRWLDSLQDAKPGYGWVGFADNSGHIVTGTRGLAVGADISQRTWFIEGNKGLAYGDLHEAMLMQKLLPALPGGETWRFVDVSMPIRDAQGRTMGVMAVHLSWPWLRTTVNVAASINPYKGTLWIVGPDNKPRLGHDEALTGALDLDSIARARAGKRGWTIETWPDGKRYVTGFAPTVGEGPSGQLGWIVLVRAPFDAISPTDQAEMTDALWVVALATFLIALAAWSGAWLWVRPMRSFIERIVQLRHGQRPPPMPARVPQEFHELNLAVLRLVDQLEEKEAKAQQSLTTVQDSFRSVGSSLPGTLSTFRIRIDNKMEFTFLNGSTKFYYGVSDEEILADARAWSRNVDPQDMRSYEAGFRQLLGEGRHSMSLPIRVTGADGTLRTLQLTVVQRDVQDRYIFDTISLDITELHQARQAAEQANRAKSDFLATMSHELRTPLNAILGFAQVLENSLERPDQRKQVRYMRETGETLTRILNDVLDIAKIEAGKFDLDPRPFNMDQVFDSCASVFRVVSAEKGVAFNVALPSHLPRLIGDPVRLRQILHNLLSNAFKFTASGEVDLSLVLEGLTPRSEGKVFAQLTIEVRDTGLGMTAEQLERLFQRFEQATRSISGQYGGTGLGLAIVKALIENMEGRIEVHSEHGKGTRFALHLALEVCEEDIKVSQGQQRPESSLHVLVVDDFHINRAVLKALLENRGHRVSEAEDGVQAIEQVSTGHPDLVLMDLDMPHMNGLEATRHIRRLPADEQATTPVYALTGKAFAEDIAEARAAGMNGHLAKPVQLDELVRVLRAVATEEVPS